MITKGQDADMSGRKVTLQCFRDSYFHEIVRIHTEIKVRKCVQHSLNDDFTVTNPEKFHAVQSYQINIYMTAKAGGLVLELKSLDMNIFYG